MAVKLSVYGTVFNSEKSVGLSISKLQDIFSGIDGGFELVIVDNYSNDRTFESLKKMSEIYENVYIFREKSNRGLGRQKAFEKTTGQYTLYFDLDDVLLDSTYRILLEKYEIFLKKDIIVDGMCRKNIIEDIGGWRSLNAGEDYELSARAIKKGYKLLSIPAIKSLSYEDITKQKREKVVLNESRYSKGFIEKNLRRLNYIADFSLGTCIRISDLKYFYKYEKTAMLAGISINYVQRRKPFCVDPSVSNIEFVEARRGFIDPGLFGIPKDMWLAGSTRHISNYVIEKRMNYFKNKGYSYVTWTQDYIWMTPCDKKRKIIINQCDKSRYG